MSKKEHLLFKKVSKMVPEMNRNRTWILVIFNMKSESIPVQFSSVAHSCLTLRPYGLQHIRLPCPPPTPGVYSNSCALSWWSHPTISYPVFHFSCIQSFPASGSFPMSHFFTSGGQTIGVSASASILPMTIQDWFF